MRLTQSLMLYFRHQNFTDTVITCERNFFLLPRIGLVSCCNPLDRKRISISWTIPLQSTVTMYWALRTVALIEMNKTYEYTSHNDPGTKFHIYSTDVKYKT
jgi:hypothetical protein